MCGKIIKNIKVYVKVKSSVGYNIMYLKIMCKYLYSVMKALRSTVECRLDRMVTLVIK